MCKSTMIMCKYTLHWCGYFKKARNFGKSSKGLYSFQIYLKTIEMMTNTGQAFQFSKCSNQIRNIFAHSFQKFVAHS